uniref:Uncharacterized protein n=1 Tax=Siphoviridae sp. ctxMM9 TaxID=2827973 RepID=A0A8S5T7B9_9CAUD|nr:MAG TPA: hypothetical protein [Siphoviridae sp. ctxMM9]
MPWIALYPKDIPIYPSFKTKLFPPKKVNSPIPVNF